MSEVNNNEGRVSGNREHVDECSLATEVEWTITSIQFDHLLFAIGQERSRHRELGSGVISVAKSIDQYSYNHTYG